MSEPKHICAADVMKGHFVEVDGMMTVKEAVDTMLKTEANVLIVKKRNEQDEHGIVLLSDIAKRVLAKDRSPERVNVYEIMSKPVIGLRPNMAVRHCARLFERFGLSVAPVIENDRVLGVLGYTELVLNGLAKIHE